MRLIDADELISRLEHWKNLEDGRRAGLVQNAINHVIITTAIDIVKCGECKWCDDKGKGRALICTNPYIDMDIHPLAFCSYGERRADDQLKR